MSGHNDNNDGGGGHMPDMDLLMKFALAFLVLAVVAYALTSMNPEPAQQVNDAISTGVDQVNRAFGMSAPAAAQ